MLRAVVIYLFLLAAFRIFGKRELGQATTMDLAVLVLVANAIQNGIIGNDVSVTGALIGAATLFALNALVARATYRFPWFATAVEGSPTVLIKDGKPIGGALRRELISLPELRAIARRQGFASLADVHSAILETNGVVTMFREDEPGHARLEYPLGIRIGKRRRAPQGA